MTDTSTRILLVRHGESVANAGGVTRDHTSIPLTATGHAQAKALVDVLPCEPTLFVVSPFLRARQTAEPFLQRFPTVPVEEWPIQEFTFLEPSRHNGTTEHQREPHVLAYWERNDPEYCDGPGAESFTSFLDRTRDAIQRLSQMHAPGCIVVFTHGLLMQAFRLLVLFPDATDAQLMFNFRRFHFIHFIQNANSLEFETRNGTIHPIGQQHITTFKLQGETSHA